MSVCPLLTVTSHTRYLLGACVQAPSSVLCFRRPPSLPPSLPPYVHVNARSGLVPPPLARAVALRKTPSCVQTFVTCCRLRLIDDRRRPALSVALAETSIGAITTRFGDATIRTATPEVVSALAQRASADEYRYDVWRSSMPPSSSSFSPVSPSPTALCHVALLLYSLCGAVLCYSVVYCVVCTVVWCGVVWCCACMRS